MNQPKKTNVYYYQLHPKQDNLKPQDKEQVLKKADKTIFSFKEKYTKIPHSHGTVNLYHTKKEKERYILGTFVYNQTSDIPPAYDDESKKPSVLDIEDFQGLGYDSSFLFDTKTRILAFESKRPGTSINAVELFIKTNFSIDDCSFKFVVLPNEFKKLMTTNEITKIEIDLSIPNNDLGILDSDNKNTSDLLQLLKDLNSSKSKLIISNGRSKKRKLDLSNSKKFIKSIFGVNGNNDAVKNLRVTANDVDTEGNHIFDLISNRLITNLSIPIEKKISRFEINKKYEQLEGEYLRYRTKLEELQK